MQVSFPLGSEDCQIGEANLIRLYGFAAQVCRSKATRSAWQAEGQAGTPKLGWKKAAAATDGAKAATRPASNGLRIEDIKASRSCATDWVAKKSKTSPSAGEVKSRKQQQVLEVIGDSGATGSSLGSTRVARPG